MFFDKYDAGSIPIDNLKIMVADNRALVSGFVDINDGDFDIVREMARQTTMPPYQNY